MSSVEAAASLFGSSDSGSDLDFLTAPEGTNSSSSHSPASAGAVVGPESNELFDAPDSSGLFDVNPDAAPTSSLFESQGEAESHMFGQSESHSVQAEDYQPDNTYDYGHDAQTYPDLNGQDYNYDEGWFDEHGQWHAYEQQQGTATTSGDNTSYSSAGAYGNGAGVAAYDTYNTSSQYDVQPGNPASTYGYQAAYVPPTFSVQATYDPYKPAAPSGQQQTSAYDSGTAASPCEPYRPAGVSSQQVSPNSYAATTTSSSYDLYRPVTSNGLSSHDTRSSLPQSSTFAGGGGLIPPPPITVDNSKPPASPYRPSTANAYDPPIPVAKSKKSLTASAFQQQGSPFSPHSATPPPVPPPPPIRKISSPPIARSTLPPGPPPRSSVHSPPTSGVSYAQAPPRSNSPYDPQPMHRYESPKPYSYGSDDYSRQPQANGQYDTQSSISSPPRRPGAVVEQQTTYFSDPASSAPKVDELQHVAAPNHEPTLYPLHDNSTTKHTEDSIAREEVFAFTGEVPPGDNVGYQVAGSSVQNRPGSSHSPVSQRPATQSPVSEKRARMSPDVASHSGGSQLAISPVSESARSRQGSFGRSSPINNRAGSSFVGQSFSALDDQSSMHDEPYGFIKRTSLDRTSSPGARSSGSLGKYVPPASLPSSSYLHLDHDAVDLTSDSASVNGQTTSPSQEYQTPAPATSAPVDPYKPKPADGNYQNISTNINQSPAQAVSDPYAPAHQYAPVQSSYNAPEVRERSMSNLSSLSVTSATSNDRYAPSTQTFGQQEAPPYANSYAVPPAAAAIGAFGSGLRRASIESSYSPPPISGPYAPSPSLLGTNDPLGRASAKVPVVSFGFGGKLVTCFHSPPTLDTGFDVALSSRKCTDVHIRSVENTIPEAALNESTVAYPGPLFGDPGSPVATLVRAAGSANVKSKTKKAKVLTYLTERAEELERGLGYLASGSVDKRRAEGKLALVRLLHVLVEHDGQLYGNSAAETAARAALLPRLATSQETGANAFLNAPTAASLATGTFGSAGRNEKPLAEYSVRRSALETVQDFLLRGEKRKAYHYALDERMWAHAMVISSSVDKEAFKEVVNEFVRSELGVKPGSHSDMSVTNGLESLRLAYSLYSGQSSTAVQHLLPVKSLQTGPSLTLQPPTPINHMTPLSPSFPSPAQATNIPLEILSQWPEHAVMLFSGQMGAETSTALTTLGDYLLSNDWVEAAHCCYLLSPQTSPIGGVGVPSVRVVLVGSQSPHRNASFFTDPDAFIFSEILEFALSLHPPVKGQEAFAGFPHLQVYRLMRAYQLAEMGQTALAKRYCEAITATPLRPSPYLSHLFSERLRELYNQLNGDPELDKSNSWIGGKLAKPSLGSVGDWIGRFVAGETEPSSPTGRESSLAKDPAYAGAFSRFSNISSTNNSRGSSPVPSITHGSAPPSILPGRTGSAAGFRSVPNYSPSDRASPAFDHGQYDLKNVPPPRALASESSTGSYGYDGSANGHPIGNGTAIHENGEQSQGGGGWWSAVYGDNNGPTPTASTFTKMTVQASEAESGSSGFVSLMDNYNSFTPSPSATAYTNKKTEEPDDFDDDLGLGNNASKKKSDEKEDGESKPEKVEDKKEEPKNQDTSSNNNAGSSSWLGRWFSRPNSTKPAPIKAKLGEETSFYYDKELKRWVNKKAGAETPKPAAPPPPPSRAQTASPSRSAQASAAGPPPPSPMPPPRRPSSAMDAGSSAPLKRNLTPLRSSLIPEEGPGAALSAPPTPAVLSSLSATPPMGRPKSAAKKNVRSRYVDVFQQPS